MTPKKGGARSTWEGDRLGQEGSPSHYNTHAADMAIPTLLATLSPITSLLFHRLAEAAEDVVLDDDDDDEPLP